MPSRGKVPHFSLRPHPVVMGALIFVPVVGLLIAMSFFSQEEGTGIPRQHGMLAVLITAFLTFCLLVLATSKLWFTHLWKKNSTHARHKQHTKYHPAVKEQRLRSR